MTKKVLIDCDPGVDDALALAVAHGSPALEVVGITTVAGNVGIERTTENALCLTELYGMDVPVARGASRPLLREPRAARHVHGESGLGNVVLPPATREPSGAHAVDFIVDSLAAAPGEISLVAVGRLTNIALALRKEPRIAEWAREFVIMGGSYTRGNVTPAAEFNVLADPEAAAAVFAAPWQTVMIGLDLTLQARVTGQVQERFSEFTRLDSKLLTPALDHYGRHHQYREKGPAIHDACAIAFAADPGLFSLVSARVDVETQGRFTSGMTVTDFTAPGEEHNALVAQHLDVDSFWDLVVDAFRRVEENLPE